jgi:hypothetical protein
MNDRMRDALEGLLSTLHHDYCDSSCPVKAAMDKARETLSTPQPAAPSGKLYRWVDCAERKPFSSAKNSHGYATEWGIFRRIKTGAVCNFLLSDSGPIQDCPIMGRFIDMPSPEEWEWLEEINN